MEAIIANYEEFETSYYQIDFGALPTRKALNLAYSMIRERLDPAVWERKWQHYFEAPEDRAIEGPVAPPGKSLVLA